MLVLSRNIGETIVIDNSIEVVILEVSRKGQVRVGIIAPRDIPVHRKEIQDKIDNGVSR